MTDSALMPIDVLTLAKIVTASTEGQRLIRVLDDHHLTGTARGFTGPDGESRQGSDMREWFLRVTLDSGTEAFWPIRDLMRDVNSGMLALNYSR